MTTALAQKNASREDWHPADIVAALHKRGTTFRKLAKLQNVTTSALTKALRCSYPRSEQRIAAAIGVPAQQIWPSRFQPDGSRIDLRTIAAHRRYVNDKNSVSA